jgi:hypothetical protein
MDGIDVSIGGSFENASQEVLQRLTAGDVVSGCGPFEPGKTMSKIGMGAYKFKAAEKKRGASTPKASRPAATV